MYMEDIPEVAACIMLAKIHSLNPDWWLARMTETTSAEDFDKFLATWAHLLRDPAWVSDKRNMFAEMATREKIRSDWKLANFMKHYTHNQKGQQP